MFSMNGFRKMLATAMSEMAKDIMPNDEHPKDDWSKDECQKEATFTKNDGILNERRTQSTVDVNRINVDSSSLDVKVSVADVSDIEVAIKGNAIKVPAIEFTTEVVEREFCVKTRIKSGIVIGLLYLEVLVPRESRFRRISITSSTGDIEISRKILVDELNVNTSSGDVSLEKLRDLSTINIKTSTGDVEVTDYVEAHCLKIETASGEVEVSNDISADEIEISTSTGDIELSDTVYAKTVSIDTCSGEVDISKLTASEKVFVETKTGDVEVANTKADAFRIQTYSGEVDIDAEFVKADIDTSTGDVTVSTTAKQDIELNVNSNSGDVSIELYNIKTIMQTISTKTGDAYCNGSGDGEHTADIHVTTTTGDIEIS